MDTGHHYSPRHLRLFGESIFAEHLEWIPFLENTVEVFINGGKRRISKQKMLLKTNVLASSEVDTVPATAAASNRALLL